LFIFQQYVLDFKTTPEKLKSFAAFLAASGSSSSSAKRFFGTIGDVAVAPSSSENSCP